LCQRFHAYVDVFNISQQGRCFDANEAAEPVTGGFSCAVLLCLQGWLKANPAAIVGYIGPESFRAVADNKQ
jgi:hypothetical protein